MYRIHCQGKSCVQQENLQTHIRLHCNCYAFKKLLNSFEREDRSSWRLFFSGSGLKEAKKFNLLNATWKKKKQTTIWQHVKARHLFRPWILYEYLLVLKQGFIAVFMRYVFATHKPRSAVWGTRCFSTACSVQHICRFRPCLVVAHQW